MIEGAVSTGHSTGPGGAMERAQLSAGALLVLRTGRGAWHAEAMGADELEEGQDDAEFRGVLFWVNLARKDKQVDPSAQVLQADDGAHWSKINDGAAGLGVYSMSVGATGTVLAALESGGILALRST